MQKQAPTIAKILVAVGFTLSCFGLLLFLWVTFGGPTPFKAQSYRFTASFSEAVTLAKQADVRIGGVSVGKVKSLSLPPAGNVTEVEIEMEPKYGPVPVDTRAILRQKTLLGESFIELTGGTAGAPTVPDGGELARSRTVDSTQIDEIFQALDEPTREAFRRWMANSAIGIKGRGLDLNDSFGNLGPFTSDATAILRILRAQDDSLQGLIRDTGTVFEALSARDQELAGAIVNSNTAFAALASRDAALAETIQIFPTFNEESRLTLNRLAEFADDTQPLVDNLMPVADNLSPTFRSIERLAPNLRHLFVNLDPLIDASQRGLPATRKIFRALRPVLASLDPFLANLNPVIRYLLAHRAHISDFIQNPPHGLAGTLAPIAGQPSPRHTLRQISYLSTESLTMHPERLSTNRGNGYIAPFSLNSLASARGGIFPNFDCKETGEGEIRYSESTSSPAKAPCFVAHDYSAMFGGGQAPNLYADP
jgi:phospholipid/cholesterol/gamma-HCH transport system substrate-binding protein